MKYLKRMLKRWTESRAVAESSGPVETEFFGLLYRIAYVTGISIADESAGYSLYQSLVHCVIVLFFLSEVWYLVSEPLDVAMLSENVSVTLLHFAILCRYWGMIKNRATYKRLAAARVQVAGPRHGALLRRWARRNRRYMTLLLVWGALTLMFWYTFPLIDAVEYNLVIDTVKLPFDHRTERLYPAAYVLVLVTFHYISTAVVTCDVFLQPYLLHLAYQYDVLGDCFRHIVRDCGGIGVSYKSSSFLNKEFERRYYERFGELVKQHQIILANTMDLRKICNGPLLLHFMASTLFLCFNAYQVTTTLTVNVAKFVVSILYLVYNLSVLLLICRWCDELRDRSEGVSEAVFQSRWEVVGVVRPRPLLLAMRRARGAGGLSAGGVYDVSLRLYTTVKRLVHTSYNAFSLLLRAK